MTFKDYFSKQADLYAKFRPKYPKELFQFLESQSPGRKRAWDCATGNGQAALSLAELFDEVIATDASDSQIRHAIPHAKIRYLVAPAESSPFIADNSIDLITVASAIHWFNFDNFFTEAQRVLAKDGLIAAWVFHSTDGNGEFDQLIRKFQHDTVGAYFPEETRQWIWTDYKSIPFPFPEIAAPEFLLPIEWTASDTLGYLSTWSAVQRYIADRGENPLKLIESELARIVESEGGVIRRNWKLCLRVGKKK